MDTLPHWSIAAAKVAVIQSSSALAEFFLTPNGSFYDTQNHALQDLTETFELEL